MTEDFEDIIYTVTDNIATITINRPDKLNSVTAYTLAEIESALDRAAKDRTVGVVVLTGTGEKSFAPAQMFPGSVKARWGAPVRRCTRRPICSSFAVPNR